MPLGRYVNKRLVSKYDFQAGCRLSKPFRQKKKKNIYEQM